MGNEPKLPNVSHRTVKVRKSERSPKIKRNTHESERREYDEQSRWWTKSGEEQHEAVSSTLSALLPQQRARLRQHISGARMYGNLPLLGHFGVLSSALSASHPALLNQPITYNVMQIATDTATSAVSKNRPKPYFLTSGGTYEQQRKAKQLNKLVDGCFYQANMNTTAPMVFRDGAIFDTGVVHVYPNAAAKKVEIDRVLSSELWIDELEAARGDPRQLHYTRNVDKDVLAAKYGDDEAVRKKIFDATVFEIDGSARRGSVSNLVTVRESWHLPSGPEENDGCHVLSIDGCVLNPDPEQQVFARDHFPFAFFHWCRRPVGFWGQSAAEQAQATQLSINQKMWYIQRSHQLGGTFKIWIPIGSQIPEESFNNELGSIGYYSGGMMPQYVSPPLVQPEIYQQIETEARHVFEIFGVSQMSARGVKPPGLSSGAAIREYKDETSERLTIPGQNYEAFHISTAKLVVEAAQDLQSELGDFSVSVPGNKFLAKIDLPKDLEQDSYTTQCWPVSSLPSDPAGRLQTIQEMIQAGFLTRRAGRRLMDFPDLERAESLGNAAEEYATMVLDDLVDNGIKRQFEGYDDLNLAKELALEYYEEGKQLGLAEERLEMLRQLMAEIDELLAPPPAPPMAPQMGAPGPGVGPDMGAPIAPPMPMQPSDMVPQMPAVS